MRLFLMIPSVLTEISFLVPGIEILPIVLKIEAEAGGMATIVIVLFGQISTVFIGVVEMKTWADIQWAKLVPTSAKGSAPSSTGMKIRPVDFF